MNGCVKMKIYKKRQLVNIAEAPLTLPPLLCYWVGHVVPKRSAPVVRGKLFSGSVWDLLVGH